MQTLTRGDPADSDSEASDTEAPSVVTSQHQQKVQISLPFPSADAVLEPCFEHVDVSGISTQVLQQ